MEQVSEIQEPQIMPREVFDHFVKARVNTFASGKKPISGLNVMGFEGYRYPDKNNEGATFLYEDNFQVSEDRKSAHFAGYEVNKDIASGKVNTVYLYGGGPTKEGIDVGDKIVNNALILFLAEHANEVRFGKNVRFEHKDPSGNIWVYEGKGERKDHGWGDEEKLTRNGVPMHTFEGKGHVFSKGF